MSGSREVHPIFSKLEDEAAAEAFSEPFLRTDDFLGHPIQDPSRFVARPQDLAAISAAYIDDAQNVAVGFALNPDHVRPLAATAALMRGYQEIVERLRARALSDSRIHGPGSEIARGALEDVRSQRLRTVAAFMVFVPDKDTLEYHNLMAIPTRVIIEGGCEVLRLSSEPSSGPFKKLGQNSVKRAGLLVAAVHMPSLAVLKRTIDTTSAVTGFASLPRSERKELVRAEAKTKTKK